MKRAIYLLLISLACTLATEAQNCGCTDPLANNYNPEATLNDGSCRYDSAYLEPVIICNLDTSLDGTSSLFVWHDTLWSANDHSTYLISAFDTATGAVLRTLSFSDSHCHDMEETFIDGDHIYFGEVGNNYGSRREFYFLRFSIGDRTVDTIYYTYPGDYEPGDSTTAMATDFDCEAFVVGADSIYLFTKEWTSLHTSCYAVPKQAGRHEARFHGRLNTDGMVTGARYDSDKRLLVLIGYNSAMQPFVELCYDFRGESFFSACCRKLDVAALCIQSEGIATFDGLTYYYTNEHTQVGGILNVPAQCSRIDLTPYLGHYLYPERYPLPTERIGHPQQPKATTYPNPTKGRVTIKGASQIRNIRAYDAQGRMVGAIENNNADIVSLDLTSLPDGIYHLLYTAQNGATATENIIKKRNRR